MRANAMSPLQIAGVESDAGGAYIPRTSVGAPSGSASLYMWHPAALDQSGAGASTSGDVGSAGGSCVHFENTTAGAPFADGPALASNGIVRSGTASVEVDPWCHAI